MKKIKILFSVLFTSIFATGLIYAWTDLLEVDPEDPLTSSIWNTMIWSINENGSKLVWITNNWWNIWINTPTPSEKLHIDGNIKLTSDGDSVIISVDSWNEILKNINKTWYKFSTHNSTDWRHVWYWNWTNFRNCEVVDYFQPGESTQNTIITTILADNMWYDRTAWSSSPYHAKFLRDFTLNSSYSNTSVSTYGSWSKIAYWPATLARCAID